MKIRQITETTAGATSSGSVASVASPMGEVQSRMQKPPKSPKVTKPKKNTYKNQISESTVTEEEIAETDLIVLPGMRKSKDSSFIPHEKDRRDHEVEMARGEIAAAAKDAMRIHKILKGRSEDQGLMGWQQSYITLASDYLNSVADSLENQLATEMTAGVLAGGMSNFEESFENEPPPKEGSLEYRALKRMKGPTQEDALEALVIEIGLDKFKRENKLYREYIPALMHHYKKQNKVNEISDFKKKELEYELRNEPKNNYQVNIDGKSWKVFASKEQAEKAARTIERKYNKKATVHLTGASPTNEAKAHKCPECGGEMVSEELMNEKKDACYYKVKSRYKVWPSAYASGALVKCRKKGASNWGNKSKK